MLTSQANRVRLAWHGSSSLSVASLRAKERRRLLSIVIAFTLFAITASLLLITLSGIIPKLSATLSISIVILPAFLVWLWQRPVRGLYVLAALAVIQEEVPPTVSFPDDIGQYFPFFEDIATWTHIKGISFSVAELYMLLIALIWLLKGIGERSLHFDKGTLMRPMSLYMAMVVFAETHGIMSGGDFRVSLWEIRSQIYMFVAYILACNLMRTRKQINAFIWILLLGTGLKGIQGTFRYLVTLHRNLNGIEALFPHEQSFFYNAYLTLVPLLFLYNGSRRMKRIALWLLPFVLIASLANQRRAAIMAIAVGMAGLLLLTFITHPPRRRLIAGLLIVLAVVLPPYYILYSGKSGLIAEPARAIASAFHPDTRDAGSNQYRVNEDKDILATMKSSPIIGYGFGKPMFTPYTLPDISMYYVWWNIMPHDSILWIWMRLGTIGYLLFWFMIGSAVVQITRLICRLTDLFLKGLAVFIPLLIIQQIIFSYLDLQWTNYRNLIFMGIIFALIGRLGTFAEPEPLNSGTIHLRRSGFNLRFRQSLRVVDGQIT